MASESSSIDPGEEDGELGGMKGGCWWGGRWGHAGSGTFGSTLFALACACSVD